MLVRRSVTTLVAAGLLAVLPGTAALAHECFVANRSAQGTQSAGNSQTWFTASAAEGYGFIFGFLLGVEPTEDQIAEALALHAEAGLQDAIAIFEHHTLMTDHRGNTPAADKHAGDGKGIDHFSQSPLGAAMVGIALDVLSS